MIADPIASRAPGAERPPRRLFAAGLIGRTANEMTPVAVVLLVLARGEGAALAGVTAGALALPGVITGPVLGAWLDRARRPLTVIAAEQAAGAAGLAALVVAVGHVPVAVTVLLAAATGAFQPLSTGGMTSVLTGLSDEEYLPRATSFEAASFGTASVAGPMLAALLAGAGGAAVAVATQSALKVAAMLMTVGGPEARRERPRGAQDREPIGVSVAAGFRHFAKGGPLAAVTVTGSLVMAGGDSSPLRSRSSPCRSWGTASRSRAFCGLPSPPGPPRGRWCSRPALPVGRVSGFAFWGRPWRGLPWRPSGLPGGP